MFCVKDSATIKDIRKYIVIWIINNKVATEISRLQENMVALENLDLSENLAPSSPLPLGSTLLKSSPQSHFFQPPLPISRGYILCLLLWEKVWTFLQEFILQMSESHAFAGTFFLQKKIMELPFKTLSVTNFWIFRQALPLFFYICFSPEEYLCFRYYTHNYFCCSPQSGIYMCAHTNTPTHKIVL